MDKPINDITTLILCGGRGRRLRPLTDIVPKPLIPLHGKPLIHHSLESYIVKGFRKFIICVGYKGQMIKDYIANQNFEAQIEFSDSGEDASMLERIYYAIDSIPQRTIISYGDTLINLDVDDMIRSHIQSGKKITITTAEVRSPFGLVKYDSNGNIYDFEEKPLQSYYVGHMIVERYVLDHMDKNLLSLPDGNGLVNLFKNCIQDHQLGTYAYNGPQITFNTQQELNQAEDDLVAFFTQQEDSI